MNKQSSVALKPDGSLTLQQPFAKKAKKIFRRTTSSDSEKSTSSRQSSRSSKINDADPKLRTSFIKSSKIPPFIDPLISGNETPLSSIVKDVTRHPLKLSLESTSTKYTQYSGSMTQDSNMAETPISSKEDLIFQSKQCKLVCDILSNLQNPQLLRQQNRYSQLNRPLRARLNHRVSQTPNIEQGEYVASSDHTHKRVNQLQQQLDKKTELIEILLSEKKQLMSQSEILLQQNSQLKTTVQRLQEEIVSLKESQRKNSIERKKIQAQRQMLARKIGFLQKINYTTDTKNMQSLREEYLEKKIQQLEDELQKSRTEIEMTLQQELAKAREETDGLRKQIATIEIHRGCMLKKLNQLMQDTEYKKLKVKYQRLLSEHQYLRRNHDNLQDEYQRLQLLLLSSAKREESMSSLQLSLG